MMMVMVMMDDGDDDDDRWDLVSSMNKFSVNLMPSPALLSAAYKALVHSYGWRSFTLLYQDNHGLMRLQDIHLSTNFRESMKESNI